MDLLCRGVCRDVSCTRRYCSVSLVVGRIILSYKEGVRFRVGKGGAKKKKKKKTTVANGNYTIPIIFQKKNKKNPPFRKTLKCESLSERKVRSEKNELFEKEFGCRGPNAVLKKIKNGNFKVTSRFLGREKKNFPPSEAVGNNKSEV